jgi:anthranilate phosphoribosyltransferase
MVVHGDGIDEIGTAGPTRVSELAAGAVRTYELRPEDFGLAASTAPAPRVSSAAESAAFIRAVLAGETGAARDLVLVNAAAVLVLAGRAGSWRSGMDAARAAVDGGGAAGALARLVETSNEYQDDLPA